MNNKRSSQHLFSQVPNADIQRSSFDRSHGLKTTFDADYLIPIFVDEALPGDTFNLNMNAFCRLATPIKPIMDNIELETFFFAVPYRLVWSNWERFNGAQNNPGDSTDFLIPQVQNPLGVPSQSLFDYMGVPTLIPNLLFSALPGRAYVTIWNRWFRDENLQNSQPVGNGDTGANITAFPILRRAKKHDYFTSALPWPQKGDAVSIGLGGVIPVTAVSPFYPTYLNTEGTTVQMTTTTTDNTVRTTPGTTTGGTTGTLRWNNSALTVDLSTATAVTINALREAFQVQRLLERDARGGTRYTEIIRSHFGVVSPDARLQRPEYLGGGMSYININPVAQTQRTDTDIPDSTPQGNLSAIGTGQIRNHGFTKSFTEHCIVIGMVCARADLTYMQGLNRMWSRRTRYDFFWPTLAHLGEQSVLNKEIYAQGTSADDLVFGYQERYAEYRYKPSIITGQFRSNFPQPLDIWHLAEPFGALPALNGNFVQSSSGAQIDRCIAVPSEPQFLMDAWFNYRCARPMPVYGVPGMIDHF